MDSTGGELAKRWMGGKRRDQKTPAAEQDSRGPPHPCLRKSTQNGNCRIHFERSVSLTDISLRLSTRKLAPRSEPRTSPRHGHWQQGQARPASAMDSADFFESIAEQSESRNQITERQLDGPWAPDSSDQCLRRASCGFRGQGGPGTPSGNKVAVHNRSGTT